MRVLHIVWTITVMSAAIPHQAAADEHPLSAETRAAMAKQWDEALTELDRRIADDPKNVGLYSRRGDIQFFRAEFPKAVADYERMVELDPEQEASHWRRGIAYFYAGRFKEAAHQFEIYHTFDDVDRENGIWRFFSQAKASGIETARKGLLKYKKDDREPFPAVYRLFAGETTPSEILKSIAAAEIDAAEREKRLFYAHLYIGLNAAIADDAEIALPHLRNAVANTWAPKAGFGPNYMWQVGRLHFERLSAAPVAK
jgi:lipoprotein NlpI